MCTVFVVQLQITEVNNNNGDTIRQCDSIMSVYFGIPFILTYNGGILER